MVEHNGKDGLQGELNPLKNWRCQSGCKKRVTCWPRVFSPPLLSVRLIHRRAAVALHQHDAIRVFAAAVGGAVHAG